MPPRPSLLLLSAALGAATALPVHAQTPTPPAIAAGDSVLTLTAEGHSTRVPDIARFTAGVTTRGRNAAAALAANAQKMNAVIAALRAAGIADRDIQTSNLSLNPQYGEARDNAPAPVVGYEASNSLTIKERKVAEYGQVVDALVAAGANQVDGPSFEIEDADAAGDEARIDAIKRARTRADLYARAAGLHVVRILTITDGGAGTVRPPMPMMVRAMAASPKTPVAAGEVETGASVTIAFELAP